MKYYLAIVFFPFTARAILCDDDRTIRFSYVGARAKLWQVLMIPNSSAFQIYQKKNNSVYESFDGRWRITKDAYVGSGRWVVEAPGYGAWFDMAWNASGCLLHARLEQRGGYVQLTSFGALKQECNSNAFCNYQGTCANFACTCDLGYKGFFCDDDTRKCDDIGGVHPEVPTGNISTSIRAIRLNETQFESADGHVKIISPRCEDSFKVSDSAEASIKEICRNSRKFWHVTVNGSLYLTSVTSSPCLAAVTWWDGLVESDKSLDASAWKRMYVPVKFFYAPDQFSSSSKTPTADSVQSAIGQPTKRSATRIGEQELEHHGHHLLLYILLACICANTILGIIVLVYYQYTRNERVNDADVVSRSSTMADEFPDYVEDPEATNRPIVDVPRIAIWNIPEKCLEPYT